MSNLSAEEKAKIAEEERYRAQQRHNEEKKRTSPAAWGCLTLFIIGVVVLVIVSLSSDDDVPPPPPPDAGEASVSAETDDDTATDTAGSWSTIQTFSGKGNQDTSSFAVSGDRVKITATTDGGSVGTYSSISLEADDGGYLGAGLSVSTEGAEEGHGETTYRKLKPGNYYISVISGVNWEVAVQEYK